MINKNITTGETIVIPFALVVCEHIANSALPASFVMSSYAIRRHGIIVK